MPPGLFEGFVENLDEEKDRIEPTDIVENITDSSVDDVFLDQCNQFFQEVTGSPIDSNTTFYKGFLEKDENIFIVFDVSEVENHGLTGVWTILDEIINKKSVFNITVSTLVTNLFAENKVLVNIKNEDGENLPIPQVLYLCNKNEGQIENVYYDTDALSERVPPTMLSSLIHQRVEHPTLKNIYLFSETILSQEISPLNIKRYALFIDPTSRFDLTKGEPVPSQSVVGFSENEVNFWSVKSPKYFVEL